MLGRCEVGGGTAHKAVARSAVVHCCLLFKSPGGRRKGIEHGWRKILKIDISSKKPVLWASHSPHPATIGRPTADLGAVVGRTVDIARAAAIHTRDLDNLLGDSSGVPKEIASIRFDRFGWWGEMCVWGGGMNHHLNVDPSITPTSSAIAAMIRVEKRDRVARNDGIVCGTQNRANRGGQNSGTS